MKIIKRLLIYILALIVILQCYSLLSMIIPNRYFYLIVLAIMSLLIFSEKKLYINKNLIYFLLIYMAGMSLLFISRYYHNIEFIFCIVFAFPLFFIYFNNAERFHSFFTAYTNIMLIISILSLFFFVFASLLGVIKPTGYYPQSQIGWGPNNYYDYYHLYCEGQQASGFGYKGTRNIALFLEGPMLTYTISFALYYELFFRKKGVRKIATIIMITTILTSLSTTGYIIILILPYFRFSDYIKSIKNFKVLVASVTLIFIAYGIYYIISDKFISNYGSFSIRIDDVFTCFKCFFKHFINGVGYQNMYALEEFRTIKRANAGLSTGLGAILAYGGLIWGIWYLIPVFAAIKQYISNTYSRRYMSFIIMSSFLLLLTVVQGRILCTVINAICWLFIYQKNNVCYAGEIT